MRGWKRRITVWGLCCGIGGTLFAGEAAADTAAVPEKPAAPAVDTLVFDLGGNDPLEGFNRSMFEVNNVFLRWVYRPVGSFYGAIMPRYGVNMVNRFADNVGFPPRMISCFFQAKWKGGGVEFLRFLTNTTVGVAGLFDPATNWFDLVRQDEDMGQAFACWGIPSGCSLMVPGVGVTNVRDGVGTVFDYALDPKTYFYGAQATTMLNAGLDPYPTYEKLRHSSNDSYWTARMFKLIARELQLNDWSARQAYADWRAAHPQDETEPARDADSRTVALSDAVWQGPIVDTLKIQWFRPESDGESMWVNLSPWNSDFDNLYQLRSVRVGDDADRDPMPYRYWRDRYKNPNAPLAVILPGLGGHCMGGMAVPLAELYYQRGWSVVVLSNAFNWEFAMTALPDRLPPGYTPTDAAAVRQAIAAVLSDLAKNEDCHPATVALAGYSQGALYALHVAAQEEQEPTFPLSKVIAINPPVEMLTAMETLDADYASGEKWDAEEAKSRILNGAGVYLAAARTPVDAASVIPLDEDSARFLIGYSYRLTLVELLAALDRRQALSAVETPFSWSDQTALYRELAGRNYRWYVEEVLLPAYREKTGKDLSLEELNQASGVKAVADALRHDDRIRVFTNADDFLLGDDDRAYLRELFQDRLTVFADGGHLGNLFHPTVREMLRAEIVEQPAPDARGVPPAHPDPQPAATGDNATLPPSGDAGK